MNRKGVKAGTAIWGLVVVAVVAVVGILYATGTFSTTSTVQGNPTTGEGFKYSYVGQTVKLNLDSSWLYNGSLANPTWYIYKVNDAGQVVDTSGSVLTQVMNPAVTAPNGYIKTGVSASGTYTFQYAPGTYFARGEVANGYTVMKKIVVPAGGDAVLSDYNQAPNTVTFEIERVDSPALSNWDLGLSAATVNGTDKTFFVTQTVTINQSYSYNLKEIKFQEDATYDFATDTDGDNTYDEGISKINFYLNGDVTTLFDKNAGIDEFEGDNLADITLDTPLHLTQQKTLTLQFEVTCDAYGNATGNADEKCGSGEDFIDSVILLDTMGNTVTADLTG